MFGRKQLGKTMHQPQVEWALVEWGLLIRSRPGEQAWALAYTSSAQGDTRAPQGLRDIERDLKFAKIKTNMAARCKLCRTLFIPSLVSCLHYQLHLPSKHPSFRNVDENYAVDVAIDRNRSKSQNRQAKNPTLQDFFDLSTIPVSPSGICGILLLSLMLAMTTAKNKTLFAWNCKLCWSAEPLHGCVWCHTPKSRF